MKDSTEFKRLAAKARRVENEYGTIDAQNMIVEAREMRDKFHEDMALDFMRNEI